MKDHNERDLQNPDFKESTLARFNPVPIDGLLGDGQQTKTPPRDTQEQDPNATLVGGYDKPRRGGSPYLAGDRTYPRMRAMRDEGDPPQRPSKSGPRAEPDGGSIDEGEYGFNAYRRNRPALSNQSAERPDTSPSQRPEPRPPSRRPRRQEPDDIEEFVPRPTRGDTERVYKKIVPKRSGDIDIEGTQPVERQKRRDGMGLMGSSRAADPSHTGKATRGDEPQGPRRRPRPAARFQDYDDEEDFERTPPSLRLIITASGAFLGVIILSIMVIQIISANQRLSAATAEAERAGELQVELGAALIEAQGLREELAQALADLDSLRAISAPPSPILPGTEPEPPTPPQGREVTVQPGDTLSGIAAREMGDSSQAAWQRIIDANPGTTAQNLRVGQTLFIPNPQ